MPAQTPESTTGKAPSLEAGQRGGLQSVNTRSLKGLVDAAKALARDQNIDHILGYLEKVVDTDTEIRLKDERIGSLQTELAKQAELHKVIYQESLSAYTKSLDGIRSQLNASQAHVTKLQGELTQKDESIIRQKDDMVKLADKLQKSDQISKDLEEKLSKSNAKVKLLQQSLEDSKAKNEASATKVKQQETQLSRSQAELTRRQVEYDNVNKLYQRVEQQLSDAQSLTVGLNSEEPEILVSKLDNCWEAISSLVCYTFFKDMPEAVLRNDAKWYRVKQPRYWDHQLPIPLSNSDAAKQMRSVVVLASIVRAMDFYIFQPTYFLAPDSGVRHLLIRQAGEDSRKESAFRAMMQALLPRELDTAATSKVNQMCDEVIQDFGPLLSIELFKKFKEDLLDIAEDARDIWRTIVLSKDAIQPNFAIEYYQDWSWQNFRFHESEAVIEDAPHPATSGLSEPAMAVFPRLYMYDKDGKDPLSHGVLFMKAETRLAKDEVEQSIPNSAVGRSGATLIKRQKGRTLSTDGSSHDKETKGGPFLDRKA